MILSFWQLRRSKRITSLQADLYYFLLQESSSRGEGLEWENPFECSNKLICAGIGISEDAIKNARNRLKQLGLIEFLPGERNKRPPVYELFYPFKTGNSAGNTAGKETGKTPATERVKRPTLLKEEHNVTKTETKTASEAIASGAVKISKKNLEATEHWKALVEVWFAYYQEVKGEEPTFRGSAPKDLKQIVENLRRRVEKNRKQEWTEEVAKDYLLKFLQYAYALTWIKDNFLLSNLNRQFDKIISSNGQSDSKHKTTAANTDLERSLAEHYAGLANPG